MTNEEVVRRFKDEFLNRVNHHIHRLRDGRIAEMWPAGGPDLS